MAKTPIRPSWADAVRIIIGGGEYAEQRLPDLFASLIAAGQDDNVLMATISHWLRTVDTENEAALGYGVARWLKGRGPAAAMLAHALETTLRTAHELNEYPAGTLAAATPEDRERFRMALVAKFQNNVERARAQLNTTFTNLGGRVADTNTPTEPKPGVFDRFMLSLSGLSDGAGELLKDVGETAVVIVRALMIIIGASVIYCAVILGITLQFPEAMNTVAGMAFAILVCVPGGLMIAFGAQKNGVVPGAAAAFMLWFVSSTLLFITFALAGAAGMYTGGNIWSILVAGPIIFVVWDRIVMGITQAIIRTGKHEVLWAKAFSSGLKVDEAERKAINLAMEKSIYLVRISITATAAVLLIWLMMVIVEMNLHPLPFHLSVLLVTGLAFLSIAYARMALALWREGDWPKHLETLSKGWATTFFQSAQRGWVVAGAVGLGLLVLWGIFNDPKATEQTATTGSEQEETEPGILQRIGDIGKAGADMALDEAEDAVDIHRPEAKKSAPAAPREEEPAPRSLKKSGGETVDCGSYGEIRAEKVRKDRAGLIAGFCDGEGMKEIYPCIKCR